MEQHSHDDALPVRFATRQPILAADETVIGYKLLFRTDVVKHFSAPDPEAAARTTIDMSMLLGLDILCDHRLAFISCNRNVLLERGLAFLPANRVVAEIERAVAVDDAVVEACCELKNAGYRIALDGFTADDPRQAIVHLADYLKVDLRQAGWEEVPELVGPDLWKHSNLLAMNVESRQDFDLARRKGFQLFQGQLLPQARIAAHADGADQPDYLPASTAGGDAAGAGLGHGGGVDQERPYALLPAFAISEFAIIRHPWGGADGASGFHADGER